MSKAYDYKSFCEHYGLPVDSEHGREEYKKHLSGLEITNQALSEKIASEAIAQSLKQAKGRHGGARKGSGRKAPNGVTKPMRIPLQYTAVISAVIDHLKRQSDAVEIEPTKVYMRDLNDRQLDITIHSRLRALDK